MEETWRPVVGYENHYEVSDYGQLRRIGEYGNGQVLTLRPMKLCRHPHGYAMTRISVNNNKKSVLIHRLMAQAFIPNPENKPNVNHKDGNKKNNSLSNLEWCTHRENVEHYKSNVGKLFEPPIGFIESQLKEVELEKIITENHLVEFVCGNLNIEQRLVFQKCRKKRVVIARAIIFYVLRNHYNFSLYRIGKKIGQHDHATVHHSIKIIESNQRLLEFAIKVMGVIKEYDISPRRKLIA